MRLLPHLLLRHGALGRHQDHEAPAARQRREEGPGGDRSQVLSAAGRLRQGEHRQPREDGQTADGESAARPGRAHQVGETVFSQSQTSACIYIST